MLWFPNESGRLWLHFIVFVVIVFVSYDRICCAIGGENRRLRLLNCQLTHAY